MRRSASSRLRLFLPAVEQLEDRNLPSAVLVPNDPGFSGQWSLNNTGQTGGKVDADIDAPEAWGVTTGSSKTVVAVIDTGIDYRHVDLYRNIWINQAEIPSAIRAKLTDVDGDGLITFWDLNNAVNQGAGKITDLNGNGCIDGGDIIKPVAQGGWADGIDQDGEGHVDDLIGWNFVTNTNNPLDDNNHGTHIAGIIGATGNDGVGIAGIDWRVQMMAVKTIAANGTGATSLAVAGLNYAVAHGATISNNSYSDSGYSQDVYDAINAARAHGHIFVTAAGNGLNYVGYNIDTQPLYPPSYDLANIVVATATDKNDGTAVYSNYGPKSVDLGAPGREIYSTVRNNGYAVMGGTSMAAAEVTGVLALVKSQHPDWQYFQVIDQVLGTVDPIKSVTGKTVTGGRLNACNAVTVARGDSIGAKVISAVPNATGAKPVSSIRLTFNEAIDASTFGLDDVKVLSGPNGAIAATGITPVAGSDGRTFDVSFATQSTPGTYTLQLGVDIRDLAGNPMNQDGDAINGEAVDDSFSTSFIIQPTYTFTNTTQTTIRDLVTTTSTITINQDIPIGDVNVKLNLKHTFDNDLYIHLRSPDGTDVVLANRRGGSADNYTNTVFDDEATTPIANGTAPFTGSFQPETPLSAFDGKNARGTWTLIIEDRQAADSGILYNWSLVIEQAAPSGGTVQTASVSGSIRTASVEEEPPPTSDAPPAVSAPAVAPASALSSETHEGPRIIPLGEQRQEESPRQENRRTAEVTLTPEMVDRLFTRLRSTDAVWTSAPSEEPATLEEALEFFRHRGRR